MTGLICARRALLKSVTSLLLIPLCRGIDMLLPTAIFPFVKALLSGRTVLERSRTIALFPAPVGSGSPVVAVTIDSANPAVTGIGSRQTAQGSGFFGDALHDRGSGDAGLFLFADRLSGLGYMFEGNV